MSISAIDTSAVSVVMPAKNEAATIASVVRSVRELLPETEVIVVDDGSNDDTAAAAAQAGARVCSHPYSKGNGAAIKTGAQNATGDIVVFMDGDGQHNPEDIPRLLDMLRSGYDMAVGMRARASQASHQRALANSFYNWFASFMVGQHVGDLTSGFRAVKRHLFLRYMYLLPNGFSYPTTITMAFFRAGYSVGYVPIVAARRTGKSHIRIVRDGIRFLLIIFKVGTLYSPLKVFSPIAGVQFLLGIAWYMHTFLENGRFTNMSALLMIAAVQVFLIGLISEQITQLMYSRGGRRDGDAD